MGRSVRVGRCAGAARGVLGTLLALGCAGAGCQDAPARDELPRDSPAVVAAPGGGSSTGGAGSGGVHSAGSAGSDSGPLAGSVGSTPAGSGGAAVDDAGTPADGGPPAPDGGHPAASVARRLAAAPSYLGSVSNGAACEQLYETRGFEPEAATGSRHPLFLYFSGTNFLLERAAFLEQITPGAEAVTRAMAEHGFVALQVDYDNDPLAWASDHAAMLACLFDGARADSLIAAACAMPQVDCDLGIATWGHSLGALVAHRAADSEPRVRAVWATGYGGDPSAKLPTTRLRVVNGELDTTNGMAATLNGITGLSDAQCPADGRNQCLRPDGSGWVIVRAADCQRSSADHCWFDKLSCADATTVLEPNWVDPGSEKAFALVPNAAWVAGTATTP